MDIRQRLAERLGSGATWRTAQSAEHPEDESHRRSADALTQLAGHVMTLPANDPRLEALAVVGLCEDAFPGGGDEVDQLIVRYGSNRHLQADPDTFLQALVGLADRNTQVDRRGGRSSTNGQHQ